MTRGPRKRLPQYNGSICYICGQYSHPMTTVLHAAISPFFQASLSRRSPCSKQRHKGAAPRQLGGTLCLGMMTVSFRKKGVLLKFWRTIWSKNARSMLCSGMNSLSFWECVLDTSSGRQSKETLTLTRACPSLSFTVRHLCFRVR